MNIKEMLSRPKGLIGLGIVAALVLLVVLPLFGKVDKLRSQGVAHETQVSGAYRTLQAGLDEFLSGAREQAGVLDAEADRFNEIMLNAVTGRYGEGSTAQPFNQPALISAVVEAYPDLKGLDANFGKLLDTIRAGRTKFRNDQSELQDRVRAYKLWLQDGIVDSKIISMLGFPSRNLEVEAGGKKFFAAEALDKVDDVIQSSVTAEAFETGTLESQDFFSK